MILSNQGDGLTGGQERPEAPCALLQQALTPMSQHHRSRQIVHAGTFLQPFFAFCLVMRISDRLANASTCSSCLPWRGAPLGNLCLSPWSTQHPMQACAGQAATLETHSGDALGGDALQLAAQDLAQPVGVFCQPLVHEHLQHRLPAVMVKSAAERCPPVAVSGASGAVSRWSQLTAWAGHARQQADCQGGSL